MRGDTDFSLTEHSDREPDRMMLSKIYVRRTCRGQGFGKEAMVFVE
jgi:hypothetical protein